MKIFGFLKDRKRRILVAGILGFIIGFWMIFIANDKLGFVPAIIGAILLLFGGKR